ncbi:hypothetical protein [Candidatus Flexifilum breve]|uniref:hypothetical protein n=1 Tax=Candidatus Flexifilum breve TaxID=3140694 RepID=UPI0031CCC5B9
MPTNRPDWSMRTVHFRDPDGNLVELFSGLRADLIFSPSPKRGEGRRVSVEC